MKVLVVDDAKFMRKTLSDFITRLGHEVVEAEDGVEAIQKSRFEQPDIIFMDIVMPKMDGISAMKVMKNEANSKFIVCSSISDKKHIVEAIKAGACDYITKPVDGLRLEDALERAIHSSFY